MTQSSQNSNKVVRHISISFKDFLPSSANTSVSIGSLNNTPEKYSNRHTNSKTSVTRGSMLKENVSVLRSSISRNVRRKQLKELSTGFKLKKHNDTEDKICNNSINSSMCINKILDFLHSRKRFRQTKQN